MSPPVTRSWVPCYIALGHRGMVSTPGSSGQAAQSQLSVASRRERTILHSRSQPLKASAVGDIRCLRPLWWLPTKVEVCPFVVVASQLLVVPVCTCFGALPLAKLWWCVCRRWHWWRLIILHACASVASLHRVATMALHRHSVRVNVQPELHMHSMPPSFPDSHVDKLLPAIVVSDSSASTQLWMVLVMARRP
jgi:hypothetical protein